MPFLIMLLVLLGCGALAPAAEAFKHPGLNIDEPDIAFIRARLAAKQEPWTGALAVLQKRRGEFLARRPEALATYTWPPHHTQPGPAKSLRFDGETAYGCALLYTFADDAAAGAKAVEILDAWGGTLKTIAPEANGNQGEKLSSGYLWPAMQNAAELMRRPAAKGLWKEDAVRRFVNRLGLAAPVLEALVLERRPEPFERQGWGSLTHAGDPKTWKP